MIGSADDRGRTLDLGRLAGRRGVGGAASATAAASRVVALVRRPRDDRRSRVTASETPSSSASPGPSIAGSSEVKLAGEADDVLQLPDQTGRGQPDLVDGLHEEVTTGEQIAQLSQRGVAALGEVA